MLKKTIYIFLLLFLSDSINAASNPYDVLKNLKQKIEKVNDYIADATIKTNVAFIKAPVGAAKIYYKKPDKLKIEKDKSIFILPKTGIEVGVNAFLSMTDYDAIDAGEVLIEKVKTRKIRILPRDQNSDIVIMDVYIDEKNLLLVKSYITTKEDGSYEITMKYGKFSDFMLPDIVNINFTVNNYKIPKTISMDFDEKVSESESEKYKNKKGKIEFVYTNYKINNDLKDDFFKR